MISKMLSYASLSNFKAFVSVVQGVLAQEVWAFSIAMYGKMGWGGGGLVAHQHGCHHINLYKTSTLSGHNFDIVKCMNIKF